MQSATTICTFTKPKNIKNSLDYEILLASHDWRLVRAEDQGADGMLVKMECKKCGIDRLSVISESLKSHQV